MAERDDQGQRPGEIRREIEQTRANMSRTIEALETKLDPARIKQQAAQSLRDNTVGRVEALADNAGQTVKGAGNDVFDAIKKNPIPAALAAIGLGWLFMESRNEGRQRSYRFAEGRRDASPYGYRYGYEYGEYDREHDWQTGRRPMERMRGTGGDIKDRASQAASNVGEKASDIASNVGEKASDIATNVGEKAGDIASTVGEKASDVAYSMRDTAEQAKYRAQHTAYRARTRLEDMMDQSPLLVGAAAVALGAAIGMALPATEKEDEMLGEARDNLMEKAQETARETVDKAQHVAKEATQAAQETAKTEAQRQNLTG
jgi:ElaB/YqjD/DUF883 family membrane-anchored ribosome-binding protein